MFSLTSSIKENMYIKLTKECKIMFYHMHTFNWWYILSRDYKQSKMQINDLNITENEY